MRIGLNFHCHDRRLSGVEYYALGLLRGLAGIDRENEYFVWTNDPTLVRDNVRSAANMTVIPVRHLGTRIARITWEHVVLPRLAARHKLDVLHCTSYICPATRCPVPCVVTIHDTLALDQPRWCKPTNAVYYRFLLKRSAAKAARVISVSQQTVRDLGRHTALPTAAVRVVYPGVDEIFRADGDSVHRRKVRARYRLPERYVLYVGNIEPKKNIATLLEVPQRLHEEGLPHRLVIAGGRAWKAAAELRLIRRGAAAETVVWIGYADRGDLPYLYQMADVFVFPSLYEGFGFPPLEAMACGTPVVSSSRGALAETAAGGALVVDPDDPQEITAGVIRMITDAPTRDRHREMGLRQSGMFTWRKSAEATLSIYKEAADGHGR
jgi:glycosyltransferase involved in cell wall biosynthesis